MGLDVHPGIFALDNREAGSLVFFVIIVVKSQLLVVNIHYTMQSLAHELQSFPKARLRKQSTRVTTATGKVLVERRSADGYVTETAEESATCGFVQDLSLDLQVGVITPFLLLCKTSTGAIRTHSIL